MMKSIIILCVSLFLFTPSNAQKSFHDFTVKAIDGSDFELSSLKGKKVLVVNVASKCGLTPQYEQLEAIYKEYGGDNFTIIAFPANNFGAQEPGSNSEIAEFCSTNYGVTFPMMEKISVAGEDIAPIYKWLTIKSENGVMDAPIKWNFQKFLINENGQLIECISPKEKPDCETIINWIINK